MQTSKFGLNQLKFNKGKEIYSRGDSAHFAYYVHTGKVNIFSPGGLLLGQIGEGEIFGERGPSLEESRSVTAEAATNCIVYPISEKTLKQHHCSIFHFDKLTTYPPKQKELLLCYG